jgi:transcriptional regulator with GAF, ATPase, and Fis domain
MRELLEQVKRFALADANVLITGETGVGKDAVALALHTVGPRKPHPFIKIDCPSLPQNLVESELFGHERGAFTDASAARPGRFELAGRGTVYLDSVGELPLEGQAKLPAWSRTSAASVWAAPPATRCRRGSWRPPMRISKPP